MSAEEHGGMEPTEAEVRWLYGDKAPQDAPEDTWAPQNLADLPDVPPVQPTLGGMGIVYPGKRHVFSGPQESAKTLAAYIVALHVIREGRKVVLIDFEMGPWDAKTRLRELGASDDDLAGLLYVEPDTPASAENVGRLAGLEPALVVVDAAAGAFQLEGLDDNSRRDVERWSGAWVTPFWKAGVATIVLDHVTKNAETRGNYAIGSERKVGGVDVHLGFTVVRPISRGDHGLYKVTNHKDRGGMLKRGHLCDFKLTSDPETHFISWEFVAPAVVDEEHPFRPTGLMEAISRYLERIMEPVPRGQIETDIKGKRDYIRLALDVLTAEGYLTESEGARGARLYLCSGPYREDVDLAPDLAPTSPLTPEKPPRPVAPPPLGGGEAGDLAPKGDVTSPQGVLDDDDGIPF